MIASSIQFWALLIYSWTYHSLNPRTRIMLIIYTCIYNSSLMPVPPVLRENHHFEFCVKSLFCCFALLHTHTPKQLFKSVNLKPKIAIPLKIISRFLHFFDSILFMLVDVTVVYSFVLLFKIHCMQSTQLGHFFSC